MSKQSKILIFVGLLVVVLLGGTIIASSRHKKTPTDITRTDPDTGYTYSVDTKAAEQQADIALTPLRNIDDVLALLTNSDILLLRQKLAEFASQKQPSAAKSGARVEKGSLVKKPDGSFSFRVIFDQDNFTVKVSVTPAGYREPNATFVLE